MPDAAKPAFRLYLLRHAKAAPAFPGQSDFDRTLDDTGFAAAEIVSERAGDRRYHPQLVLSSTAVRCRQTADALRRGIAEDLDIRYVDALYTGDATVYRDLVAAQDGVSSVMLVGHNPVIEELLRAALDEPAASRIIPQAYPPGALAALDFAIRPSDAGAWQSVTLAAWIDPDSET